MPDCTHPCIASYSATAQCSRLNYHAILSKLRAIRRFTVLRQFSAEWRVLPYILPGQAVSPLSDYSKFVWNQPLLSICPILSRRAGGFSVAFGADGEPE